MKVMPISPDVDLQGLADAATEKIENWDAQVGKVDFEPVAFGLKAVNLIFQMNEDKGSTEDLENQVAEIEGVNSVDITDVRRALG